tara:strand:- start:3659 stop:4288 length:630 start_codon:yes stop_codon:yes gene_type:complete
MLRNYEKFYEEGGFHYNAAAQKRWLFENTPLQHYPKESTLLDAACGDGFFSFLLADYFDVTGIDVSTMGIEAANKRKAAENVPNVKFILGDALTLKGQFDVVFCRAPSFLNFPSSDIQFQKNLKKMFALCTQELYFIMSTKPPYERWQPSDIFTTESDTEWVNSRWYYHDPVVLQEVFDTLGTATVHKKGNYLVAHVSHDDFKYHSLSR